MLLPLIPTLLPLLIPTLLAGQVESIHRFGFLSGTVTLPSVVKTHLSGM